MGIKIIFNFYQFTINFFFINLHDINKRKFFVIMHFIDNYVLLAVISNSHSLFKTIQFKKYAVNMQEPFNINVK